MDFRELFPDTQERDHSAETITLRGKETRIGTLQFSPITSAPPGDIRAAWVDGGNATLASTPNRAIAIIKACAVHTIGMRRDRLEGTTILVSVTASGDDLIVRAKVINGDPGLAAALPACIARSELAPSDEQRALLAPAAVIDILRAILEHALATRMSAENDIVIKDGSLRTPDKYLRARCATDDPKLFALAKTSTLLTSDGRPLAAAMMARAPAATAWNAPLDDTTDCVRLRPHARHAFLLERASGEGNGTRALALLHAWSADMAFPGYPYPLVLADQLARVTDQERGMWRAMLASDADAAARLQDELHASDAHDTLEHILYGNRTR